MVKDYTGDIVEQFTWLGWENTYKQVTRDTAQYPKEREMEYLMIGLANEVGELLGKYKKMVRGDETKQTYDGWIGELGDIMWYFVRICGVLDVSLYEVMVQNTNKLMHRLKEGTIKGDGDDR